MTNGDEGRFRLVRRGDPTQVLLRRIAAFLLDAVVLLGVIALVAVATPGTVGVEGGDCPDPIPAHHACFDWEQQAYLIDRRSVFLYFGVLIVVIVLLLVVLRRLLGTTLGKWLLQLRVVDREGRQPRWQQSMLRAIALPVDAFLLILPFGLWLALFTPGHRRVGDLLARTWVVRAGAAGRPPV